MCSSNMAETTPSHRAAEPAGPAGIGLPGSAASTVDSWKQAVDQKLHRLHSLLFGSDIALERGEAETALGLTLRLLGFLESECQSAEDRTYISPIEKRVRERLDAAREKVAAFGDRYALEQAKSKENCIFRRNGAVDLDKIKQSKYYKPFMDSNSQLSKRLLQASPRNFHAASLQVPALTTGIPGHQISLPANKVENNYLRAECANANALRASRSLTQSKITTAYSNKSTKSVDLPGRLLGAVQNCSAQDFQTKALPSHGNKFSNNIKSTSIIPTLSPTQFANEEDKPNDIGARAKRRRYVDDANCVVENVHLPENNECNEDDMKTTGFVTAKQKMAMDSLQKHAPGFTSAPPTSPSGGPSSLAPSSHFGGTCNSGTQRISTPKTLGMGRRGVRANFIPPIRSNGVGGAVTAPRIPSTSDSGLDDSTRRCLELLAGPDGELPEILRNLEPRLIEHVSNEIMDRDPNVRWDDIAGLEHAKKCVTEMVIWPLLRPDIFQGCRSPGKGLLLFGPPGTGKTMIGKAIAGEAKATFFYISASSLTSRWIGEGEKLVRALFGVASCRQPAVIFIDEIDSLLSQRKSEGEHESSRRLKTQFLIEMEGFGSGNDRLLLIGATNRPQELDEAARRRLSKRLYIPLPSAEARAWIVQNLLKKDGLLTLSDADIDAICGHTKGYSGSDMSNLVKEASMGPLRELLMQGSDISKLKKEDMRPVMLQDFLSAVQHVKPSVSPNELGLYENWNNQFGSHSL
eukprot:c24142_g1_i1 orf=210-2450(-)